MPQSLSPTEFHQQYAAMLTAFTRHLAKASLRQLFSTEADAFFQRCALGVWKAKGLPITPSHVEYYNGIYATQNQPGRVLYWELVSLVDGYPGFSVPPLLEQLRRHDKEHQTQVVSRFLYDFSLILLLFAAVDGSVSRMEAGFIQQCSDKLMVELRLKGDPISPPSIRLYDYVTEAPSGEGDKVPDPTPAPAPPVKEEVAASPEEAPSLEALLEELDALCGLDHVKKEVHSLINLVKIRKLREENGLPVPPMSLHMVFMGNPGTGKTTVARLLSGLYRAIGVLSKGQLVEVDRSGLVAGFVGQTALKTSEVIQKAIGGILFIDEAYALASGEVGNDFGREAIEVLLKGMEDHRRDLVVIVAGYTELMGRFISSNPGLESRFNKYLYFEDYTAEQMLNILGSLCQKHSYTLSEEAKEKATRLLVALYEDRNENFGNARDVRNLFEKAIEAQANRLSALPSPTKEDLMTLLPEDFEGEA